MKYQVVIIDVKSLICENKIILDSFIQPPKDGVKEFLEKLSSKFTVKLYCKKREKEAIKWIIENGFMKFIDDVVIRKEKCELFIDKDFLNILRDMPEIKF